MRAGAANGDVSLSAVERRLACERRERQTTYDALQAYRSLHPELLDAHASTQLLYDMIELCEALLLKSDATIGTLEAEADRERRHPQCNHPHAD